MRLSLGTLYAWIGAQAPRDCLCETEQQFWFVQRRGFPERLFLGFIWDRRQRLDHNTRTREVATALSESRMAPGKPNLMKIIPSPVDTFIIMWSP